MENDPAFMVGFVIGVLLIGAFFGGICAGIASSKGRSTVGWFFGGFFMGYVIFPFIGIVMIILVSCLPNLKEKRNREDAQERENRRLREQLVQEQIKNEAFRQHAATRLDQHDVHIGVDTRQTVPVLGMGMPQFGAQPQLLGHDPMQAPTAQAWPGAMPAAVPATAFQPLPGSVPTANGVANVAMGAGGMMPHPAIVPAANGYAVAPPPLPEGETAPKPAVTATREWHYESRGETRGPITDRQLVTLAKSGEITSETLVWTEQLGDWKPAGQIKPLQPHLRTA